MIARFARQWFLMALALVLAIGMSAPKTFENLADVAVVRHVIVAAVMFVTTLPLDASTMLEAMRRPGATILGVALNFGLLPLLAWSFTPLLRVELATGLMVMAAVPCTIASAAVWTRRAGGNDVIAILVTIITNVSCFVVTPIWLFAATGKSDVEIHFSDMAAKLGLLVVLPMIAAQLVRQLPAAVRFSESRKVQLGVFAQFGILSMLFLGAVQCGLHLSELPPASAVTIWEFLAMGVSVLVVHLATLGAGHAIAALSAIDRGGRIAVGFAGSQKTLMVALHVTLTYYGGLTILPLIVYHVTQLSADTIIADNLGRAADRP